jgi:hypothetical protein
MHRARVFVAVFLTSLLAGSVIPAAAQDEDSGAFDFGSLEGIEAAVSRTWSIDFAAIRAAATPSEDFNVFAGSEGLLFMYGWVIEFDSDDNAAAAFDTFRESGPELILGDMDNAADFTIEESELADIGDRALVFDVSGASEEEEAYFRYAFAQEGSYVLFAIGVATTPDTTGPTNDVLASMVNDGGKSEDDVTFDEAGGSTGGLWGFFPEAGADVLGDLIPLTDMVIYPAPEETTA